MIAIKPNKLETVIEVVIHGKITNKDMEDFKDQLKDKKGQHTKINLFLFVHEGTDLTLKALIDNLRLSVKHWEEFHKIAIFSDKKWIEISAKISEYVPSALVRHYNLDERDKALEWIER